MSVEIEAAVKAFAGRAAVAAVTARLETGEFFVVLGPSGCGKSTLLRLVAGLERLDAGAIRLDGKPVSGPDLHVPPEARAVGVVFQSYALWPHMTVLDNVAFPVEAGGTPRARARDAAAAHLDTVDLGPFAARLPADLSGGQRQRVALARCLAGGARTILMDEPLANLDPHLRGRMETEIARFHRDAGVSTIYITHDQREAMALADRIAVMWDGRFLQVAAPQEIHDRPATEEVARFIGRAAVLDAEIRRDGAGWRAAFGGLDCPVSASSEGPGRLVLRPGDIMPGQAGLPARLEAVFYRGGLWEGLARVEGISEPLPMSSAIPLRNDDTLRIAIRGGWVLPDRAR